MGVEIVVGFTDSASLRFWCVMACRAVAQPDSSVLVVPRGASTVQRSSSGTDAYFSAGPPLPPELVEAFRPHLTIWNLLC